MHQDRGNKPPPVTAQPETASRGPFGNRFQEVLRQSGGIRQGMGGHTHLSGSNRRAKQHLLHYEANVGGRQLGKIDSEMSIFLTNLHAQIG